MQQPKTDNSEADFPEIAPLPNLPIDRQGFSDVVTDADHVLRRYLWLMDRVPGAAGYILSIMSKRWSCLWRIAIARATLRTETCKPKSSNRTRRTPAKGLPGSICQRLSTASQRVSSSSVDRSKRNQGLNNHGIDLDGRAELFGGTTTLGSGMVREELGDEFGNFGVSVVGFCLSSSGDEVEGTCGNELLDRQPFGFKLILEPLAESDPARRTDD